MSGCSNNNAANGKGIIDTKVRDNIQGIWLVNCSSNTLDGNDCFDNNAGIEDGTGVFLLLMPPPTLERAELNEFF